MLQQIYVKISSNIVSVEFVVAPQHETSCGPETTKEDFDYWRKIIEEGNLEVCR